MRRPRRHLRLDGQKPAAAGAHEEVAAPAVRPQHGGLCPQVPYPEHLAVPGAHRLQAAAGTSARRPRQGDCVRAGRQEGGQWRVADSWEDVVGVSCGHVPHTDGPIGARGHELVLRRVEAHRCHSATMAQKATGRRFSLMHEGALGKITWLGPIEADGAILPSSCEEDAARAEPLSDAEACHRGRRVSELQVCVEVGHCAFPVRPLPSRVWSDLGGILLRVGADLGALLRLARVAARAGRRSREGTLEVRLQLPHRSLQDVRPRLQGPLVGGQLCARRRQIGARRLELPLSRHELRYLAL
mmetsp:Transcript_122151/g.380293  ORF Transcript_122151/g.380293 Transcript_122151/m.380293 type:complete len:300 (-) Transcript_122151:263-1162(-)